MKQRIDTINLKNKTVIVRCDLNVPIRNGRILDDTKIIASLDTIRYLLKENCKIIILSHLGKVKTLEDKLKYSLEPIAIKMKQLLGEEIYFSKKIFDPEVSKRVS